MAESTQKLPMTAVVPILGRDITVKRPNETQMTLMHRESVITEKALNQAIKIQEALDEAEGEPDKELEDRAHRYFSKGLGAAGEMLDIVENLVVEEEDREFLVAEMRKGNLEIDGLLGMFEVFKKKGAKGAPKKAQRVRR